MGWVEITDTKTGRVLCDTRVDVYKVTEREMITDSKGEDSYSGRIIDEREVFTISDSSILSNWLKTNEAHMFGFHNINKHKDCEKCNGTK